MGLNYEVDDDSVAQKVGKDRIGDQTGLLESLGPTFLLLTFAVVLVITLVSILMIICRQCKSDLTCGKLVTKARKKIFYGMIIRFLLMNALKLNVTLISGARESTDKALSICLLVLMQLVPVIFTYVLVKIEDDLDSEENE